MYLGWPARFIDGGVISCKLFVSLSVITALLKFASTTIFAVGVYVFINHENKKLKWYVIIPYIVVTWTVATLTVSVPLYLEDYGAQNIRGFCAANLFSGPYIGISVSLTVGALLFLSIELISCILTVIYMKRNVLEGNASVKKAIAKVLGYMAAVSVPSFINSVLPYFIPMIFETTSPDGNLTTFLAGIYVTRVCANITAFPTPIIVTIILLKPVRDAIKTMSKKVCPCCHKNQEATTEKHFSTGVFLFSTNEGSKTIGDHMASTDMAHFP